MTTFRNLTVGHTAHRVVFGHSAIRYVVEAYSVSSEAGASANVKAAVSDYSLNGSVEMRCGCATTALRREVSPIVPGLALAGIGTRCSHAIKDPLANLRFQPRDCVTAKVDWAGELTTLNARVDGAPGESGALFYLGKAKKAVRRFDSSSHRPSKSSVHAERLLSGPSQSREEAGGKSYGCVIPVTFGLSQSSGVAEGTKESKTGGFSNFIQSAGRSWISQAFLAYFLRN